MGVDEVTACVTGVVPVPVGILVTETTEVPETVTVADLEPALVGVKVTV